MIPEEEGGQNHDEHRGGIQKDRSHRHGALSDDGKVAPVEEQQSTHAGAEEVVPVPGMDTQGLGVGDQQVEKKGYRGHQIPGGHPLQGGQAHGGEHFDKHTDPAPQAGGGNDTQIGFFLHDA